MAQPKSHQISKGAPKVNILYQKGVRKAAKAAVDAAEGDRKCMKCLRDAAFKEGEKPYKKKHTCDRSNMARPAYARGMQYMEEIVHVPDEEDDEEVIDNEISQSTPSDKPLRMERMSNGVMNDMIMDMWSKKGKGAHIKHPSNIRKCPDLTRATPGLGLVNAGNTC